jgi:hypothetical protein
MAQLSCKISHYVGTNTSSPMLLCSMLFRSTTKRLSFHYTGVIYHSLCLTLLLGSVSSLRLLSAYVSRKCLFHAGWATDLKTVSDDVIKKRAQRTGDGTHTSCESAKSKVDGNNNANASHEEDHSGLWGWGKNGQRDYATSSTLLFQHFLIFFR